MKDLATGLPSKKKKKFDAFSNFDFQISYEGKIDENEILFSKSSSSLEHIIDVEGDYKNRLYYGDNLEILKKLLDDSDVRGKVKLIYIDPPYATKSSFESRSQEFAYDDLLSGSYYLEFLRQRLILMRELLADDGSIYVHLDSNMAFAVKLIMDEVFGEKNFRNWITRKKCNPKNYTRNQYGNISDYILFYSKTKNYIFNQQFTAWDEETSKKEYQYIEKETGRRFKKVPIHAPGVRNGETGMEWKGMLPPPGKHWQYRPKTLDEMDERGEIYWSANGNPRRKVYLDQSKGIAEQDIWMDFKDAHNQNIKITGYPTEKNPDMLKQIISASSNEGDLVLDAFSGSGTTCEVAESNGRKWIGIDNSYLAITTTLKRLANGTERMGDYVIREKSKESTTQLSFDDFDKAYKKVFKSGLEVLVDKNYEQVDSGDFKNWIEAF